MPLREEVVTVLFEAVNADIERINISKVVWKVVSKVVCIVGSVKGLSIKA